MEKISHFCNVIMYTRNNLCYTLLHTPAIKTSYYPQKRLWSCSLLEYISLAVAKTPFVSEIDLRINVRLNVIELEKAPFFMIINAAAMTQG